MESAATIETHAVLGVAGHLLGIPSSRVEELFVLGEVHKAPGTPSTQRGVTCLRGRVMPVVDVRAALGLPPALEELNEFIALLDARQKDHEHWIAELEASVREGRPFTLTTDPHRCKFGQWYDHYRTDNVVVSAELGRFAEPHGKIHALAIEVEHLKNVGDSERALDRIQTTRRTVLAGLLDAFDRTRDAVRSEYREIGVVVSAGNRLVALAVDRAEAVAPLERMASEDDPVGGGAIVAHLVESLMRWKERPQPVLLCDLDRMVAAAIGLQPRTNAPAAARTA